MAKLTEPFDDPGHLHGIPHQHIIRQETETGRLIHDFFVIADLKGSLIGKEETAGKLMTGFSRDTCKIGHGMDEAVFYAKIRRTDVLPICNRRAISALLTPRA